MNTRRETRSYDVVVVGAGPAGSAAARFCSEQGLSTVCIEEHGTIGYPVQCAGLLSLAAFEKCRVSGRSIVNEVTGAEIISASGDRLPINGGKVMAYVVDRGALDREMAEKAASSGAEYWLKTRVTGVTTSTVRTCGTDGQQEVSFKILIAADGPRSSIARMRGIKRSAYYLAGIQAEVPDTSNPRIVSIYPDASPEFFAWRIPAGNNRARIGLAGMTGVGKKFSEFSRLFSDSRIELVYGTLPIGVMPRTYGSRTLYIGDAGGFPKPTSGGGVYTGIRTAKHAATVTAECIRQGSYLDTDLSRYETLWKKDIGKELATGMMVFRMRQGWGPEDTRRLITTLSDPAAISLIEKYGDMDRPSRVIRELLKSPAGLSLLRMAISHGGRAMLRHLV